MTALRHGIVGTGFGFATLFIAGGLLLGGLFGSFADSDAHFIAYYTDESHHPRDLAGSHLFVAAALSLLLVYSHLVRRLRELGGSETDLQAALASGLAAATLLLAGSAAIATVTMTKVFARVFDDEPLTSPAVSLAPQLGYVLVYFPAAWAAALAIGLITRAAWRAHLWPRGLRWLGVAAAGLLPLSWIGFVPILLLPIWVLAVSVWHWRAAAAAPGRLR